MSSKEIRQKKKDFAKSLKDSGILAMRKFIFLVLILLLPVISFAQSGWHVQNSGTSSNLNDIFFINQSTGWAVGDNGTIVKTINGGFSWYLQSSGTSITLRIVQFLNQSTGWIMGGHFNSPPNPFCMHSSVVIKTTNGGQNWLPQILTTFGSQYNDFNIIDSNIVFHAGESIDNTQCIMGIGSAGKTTNGGMNWNYVTTPTSTAYHYKSTSFINSLTGYVTAIHSSDVIMRLRKILKTTNGGINWTVKATDSLNGTPTFENNFLRFFDENTGYYINGNFFRTNNGGNNWFKFDSLSVYGMSKFSFINLSTGYLVGQNKLVKTSNAGTNFITNSGATFTGLNSVSAVDTNNVWACGAGGKIVYGGKEIKVDTASIKYFPLKVGNSWTYRWQDDFFRFGYNKFTVTGDSIVNGYRYYKMFSNDAGYVANLVALDSLTGNLYWYSGTASCNGVGGRLLRDSLAAKINNTFLSCRLGSNKCIDTSDTFIFGATVKTKQFDLDGLVNQKETYAKGFGLMRTVTCEGTCNVSDLQGCVIDGIVYGDTSLHASPFKAYLPLKVGNSWTYVRRVIPAPDEEITITIVGETTINGVKYYQTNQPFPTFMGNENLITLDTVTGNIFTYDATLNCTYNPEKKLKDSLAAKQGNFFTSCNAFMNGRCTDTNNVTVFGSSIKSISFISPYYVTVDCSQTFAKGFGMVRGIAVEGDIINYSLVRCTIDGIHYGDSLKSISGTVKFADNSQPATNGYVKAIKLNASTGNIITYDSVRIGLNGTYNLHVPSDLYYIVAYPNSEKEADFVPTYYPSTISWQSAVKVNSANSPSNVNISVYRKNESSGAYSVNGWVTAQTTNLIAGVKEAIIYIKQGNNFRDFYITQNSGQYSLNSLTSGNYEVVVDRLGYVSAQQNITVTNDNLENINFALIRVGIHTISNVIPDKFSLYQNYPNPFNPVTNIKFDIPKSSFVTLKIYNVLGKEETTLLNENKTAGSYEVDFNASAFTSGVYFYRIETESFTETKRMVILK